VPREKISVVGVHVDNYWTYCEDDEAYDGFYDRWSRRYTASSTVAEAGSDFCSTTFTHLEDGSLSMTCGKLINAMSSLLADNSVPILYETPTASDTLTRICEPPSTKNPLVDKVSEARSILGLGLYIAQGVRTDCPFAVLVLSQYVA
jgi:hypothetical protein